MKKVRWAAALLAVIMAVLVMGPAFTAAEAEAKTYDDFLTMEVMVASGSNSGSQTGWMAKVLKDKFNMEFNIVNIASDPGLLSTRTLTGDVGDLVVIYYQATKDLFDAGLLLDVSEYADRAGNYFATFPQGVAFPKLFLGTDDFYGMGFSVTSQKDAYVFDGNACLTYLRMDAYYKIGAPEIKTAADLVQVLTDMCKAVDDTQGGPVYALPLFADWDGNQGLACAKWYTQFLGCHQLTQYLHYDLESHTMYNLLSDDGPYKKALQFFFELNQNGVLEPNLPGTADIWGAKAGTAPFAFIFNDWYVGADFRGEGIGYMPVVVDEYTYVAQYLDPKAVGNVTGMFSFGNNCKDPGRLLDFIDWLSTPEGIMVQTNGPQGLTWDYDENGIPYITPFGLEAGLLTGSIQSLPVPEEFGGGNLGDGMLQLPRLCTTNYGLEINPENNLPYRAKYWASPDLSQTDLEWRAFTGAVSIDEYIAAKGKYVKTPVINNYSVENPDSELQAIYDAAGTAIENASWRMIIAANQAEFDAIWAEVTQECMDYGWADLMAFYDENDVKMFLENAEF